MTPVIMLATMLPVVSLEKVRVLTPPVPPTTVSGFRLVPPPPLSRVSSPPLPPRIESVLLEPTILSLSALPMTAAIAPVMVCAP